MKMLDDEIISRRITFVKVHGQNRKVLGLYLTQELKNIGLHGGENVVVTIRKDNVIEIKVMPRENPIAEFEEALPEPVKDDKVDNDTTSQ